MTPELESYRDWIAFLRDQVINLVADAAVESLNWRPIEAQAGEATNSLAVMAAHVAGAEHYWVGEVVGGLPTTRMRDTEFAVEAVRVEELLVLLRNTAQETEQVLASLGAGALDETRMARGKPVTVRWALVHVIEHTALHMGHLQLTRQLWHAR